jgi:hypothetical protein
VDGARRDFSVQPYLNFFQDGTAVRVFAESKDGEQDGLFKSA